MLANEFNTNGIDTHVVRTDALSSNDLSMVHQLFDLSFRQATHPYLEKSFSRLRYMALAKMGDTLVGFAVADAVKTRLPRLTEPQVVLLAGISCVAADYRRMGLFRRLETLAANASGLLTPETRFLTCGRMAHPASFRIINQSPAVIPKYGVPLSDWHKEMGLTVAELYGVNLDPETFVVIGEGSPFGYPVIEYQVEEREWLPFKAVNPDRGDSLLGITWTPDAPEGW